MINGGRVREADVKQGIMINGGREREADVKQGYND